MKKLLFLIPFMLVFISACGDIDQSLSKKTPEDNSTNQPINPDDNNNNGGQANPGGDGEGGTTTEPNPGGDGEGGTTVDPEPGGDGEGGTTTDPNPGGDGDGGTTVDPNPGGDGEGGTTTDPNPGGDGEGGTTTDPNPGGDGDGGTTTDPNPGGDGEGSTTTDPNPGGDGEGGETTDPENPADKPAYDRNFNASIDVFQPQFYYGRSLLTEEEQKAYDIIMDTLVKFNITENNANDRRIGVQLTANNVKVSLEQLKKVATTIGNDEQRLTYITSFVPKWKAVGSPFGASPAYENGYVKEVFFDVRNVKPAQPEAILQDTKLEHEAEMQSVEEGVVKILLNLKEDMTDAQKFRVLHDEFIKSVSYGQQSYGVSDIRGGFGPDKKVLCEGYARSLAYLCQRAGLEVIYVVGTATYNGTGSSGTTGFDHAWIKVKIDGQWYNVDPTNNDAVVAGSDKVFYNNFLQTDSEFFVDHIQGQMRDGKPVSYDEFPQSALESYPLDMTEYTK